MSSITIREVKTRADKLAFLKVPFAIYKDDPNWVAPLYLERLDHLNEKKNPYFHHAEAQLFIAEKNGEPVGRISAQVDRLHLERHKDACGMFGFLEAQNDPEIFNALFAAAEAWLKVRGMKKARGPFSYSINDETGLLVDGLDTPPSMMMGHARAFYPASVEANGYTKVKDVFAYSFDPRLDLPKPVQRIYDRAMSSGNIKIRPIDKKNLRKEIDLIMSIFNDAWSENWGFIPFTEAELNMLASNFKMLVHGESVQIASYKGEDAAFIVSLPNINEWFAGMNGSILPFNWAKLVGKLVTKKSKTQRVPLMGVRKKFQDGLLGAGLSLAVIKGIYDFHKARGVEQGELSWILEDNLRVRHVIESIGSRHYKTYRVYEKQIA